MTFIPRASFALSIAVCSIFTSTFRRALPAASRSAPGVIVFSGGPLRQPVVLSDWAENQELMAAASEDVDPPDSIVAGRPRISVEMFWGAAWSPFASSPDSLAQLRRIHEHQDGIYYPTSRGRPALWVFGPQGMMPASTRRLAASGIAILRRHQVPVSIR